MATTTMSPPSDLDLKAGVKVEEDSKPALTPPTSEGTAKKDDDSGSELSDLEPEDAPAKSKPAKVEEENEEIVPDHYYEGGKIPVFKPTMKQFRSFKDFIHKIDKYGMKSGIVKVIPPKEWRDALPSLDEQVKTIKVKNPITQEFHGTHGTYTQANIEKQRSYNLPQWKALCEESNHQPPARRGERRRNQGPAKAPTSRGKNANASPANSTISSDTPKKRGPGRPRVRPLPVTPHKQEEGSQNEAGEFKVQVPPTPTSPPMKKAKMSKAAKTKKEHLSDEEDSKPKGRQPKSKSVSSRRQHNKQDQANVIDEEAFKGFDYRVYNQDEWTTERIQELETAYWKSLTFNNPMYGADMPGSLFDDSTQDWNVAKLENLLDVLGQKVPGVNTAYLYLGQWKASFAWHLEDVDLYSINYIHFGAPKQWYSISQEDARRFEGAMRSVWPNDAKNCDQFLRHKTYLISPQLLQSQYNIRVNRLVHNEGEFVITFPYGYHSGYNLGYNCAESVNFATPSWLDYGRVARKCNCEADSVWVDVREIERKLRGEPTPEYYEETDDDEDDEDEEEGPTDLPTPPGSVKGKPKRSHKRKRDPADKDGKTKVKKLRIKIKAPAYEPCVLCPNDVRLEPLLPTDDGRQAHRRCGLYTPETVVLEEDGVEKVCDVAYVDKARWELKCNFCRSKRGTVFQCSQKKCTRAYHATCAAPAGVQVDIGVTSVFGEDGTEYKKEGIDFRCRIHRGKRSRNSDSITLEDNKFIYKNAAKTAVGEVIQAQFYQGEIFAGIVLENRRGEQNLLVEVLPKGDQVEVEYKWLLFFDPVNSQLPMPSENAQPLPPELARRSRTTASDPATNDGPKANDPFCDEAGIYKWSEFDTCKPIRNSEQVKIDISQPEKLWYFLGKTSTEAKAQYTHDPAVKHNNPKSNFLSTVAVAAPPVPAQQPFARKSFPASYPGVNQNALNAARANGQLRPSKVQSSSRAALPVTKERPYTGKYAITDPAPSYQDSRPGYNVDAQALQAQRAFQQRASMQQSSQQYHNHQLQNNYGASNPDYRAATASMMSGPLQRPMAPSYSVPSGYNFNRVPPSASQPQQYQQQYPQAQAPVANMMGGSSQSANTQMNPSPSMQRHLSASINPLVQTSSVSQNSDLQLGPPASAGTSVTPIQELKKISRLDVSEKYVYLHEAEKARPQVYQSPYAPEGGFTAPYLPVPAAKQTRPRGPSISEDFLMKRTPSQQESVAVKMSEDKARLQEKQNQQLQRRQSLSQKQQPSFQPTHQRSHSQSHTHQHPPPQHLPLSAIQQPSTSHHNTSYYDSSQSTYPQFSNYPSESYPSYQPNTQQPYQYAQNFPLKPPYATYQSPQAFQAQMKRESLSSNTEPFDQFCRGLQNAAAGAGAAGHTHSSAISTHYGGMGGDQGSPLKYEMGGGGEMLPMMDEGRRE